MRILIVDDEAPARSRLRQLLEEGSEHEIAGDAATGEQALALAAREKPDVVLLDIRMPGMSGLETAMHLNSLEKPPAIVFTTAYDEYAVEAFEAQAVGYILKPVRRERLNRALERAGRLNAAALGAVAERTGAGVRRAHICARLHDELRVIPVESIHYFQADQKYTRVCHEAGEDLIEDSLKQLEREFGDRFVRIHRSALVATDRIETLQKSPDGAVTIRLRDGRAAAGDGLTVSRRHLAAVRKLLKGKRN